ncbi:MAG TPA: PRC-barrel domain-containing protein [Acetivibrio sp.]|uniref:PRC-barrel domain-containing protein n=1 Tax=Acetivibrio sp. TaxID=1872092 RepID=UPI002D1BABED|nr:PRC-barrel domain-containing protein [Acetivibrio sp.]HOM02547.1 PRC-barrel domain-containing protein [Acetivibrio sp.]
MNRYSEVLGLPVICAADGKKLGIVKDIIFCPKEKSVVAFLLERRGYSMRRKVVFASDVLSLGRDALIVNDVDDVKDIKKVQHRPEFKDKWDILGLPIYTKTGEDLGVAKDVLFDLEHGKIDGIEVSDGLLQDIVKGRSVLPLIGKFEFGEENILVDSEAVEEMMETGGGIKNLIEGNKKVQRKG